MSPSISSMSLMISERFSSLPEEKLSSTRTLCPCSSKVRTRFDPINPAPPVTKYFIATAFVSKASFPSIVGETVAVFSQRWADSGTNIRKINTMSVECPRIIWLGAVFSMGTSLRRSIAPALDSGIRKTSSRRRLDLHIFSHHIPSPVHGILR
jgi:hypothetical protein